VTFRVLGPTPTPTPTPTADRADEGPSSLAESGNDQSVALDADNGGHGSSWSGSSGGHRSHDHRSGDIRSTALTGLAATLVGAVALCLAAVRDRARVTRGRRRVLPFG
jgi:hypothetical protein